MRQVVFTDAICMAKDRTHLAIIFPVIYSGCNATVETKDHGTETKRSHICQADKQEKPE